MTDLKLTEQEIRQNVVDDRKKQLLSKFDKGSGQGILPFTNERLFEQSNPILRSALFTAGKIMSDRVYYNDWTEIFSLGSGSILYKGPSLTVDHENVLVRIMALARGKSVTKPIHAFQADVLRWLDLDINSGHNYEKARKILDDLATAELRISSKPALQRILSILTSPAITERPDGQFFKDYIDNRYKGHLKMIAEGLENDQPVNITMKFLTSQTHNSVTKKMMLSLDPICAVFFDGVNTTLLPFEIMDQLDRFGRKLLPFIASHRDGVFAIRLKNYHEFSGSKSDFKVVGRRFKSDLKRRFTGWQEKGWINSGWTIEKNNEGDEIVSGLKLHSSVRLKSNLEMPVSLMEEDWARGSDEAMESRFQEFKENFEKPRSSTQKKSI
ncbi:TrfA [Pseudomonas syringae]|uniref:TrfA n=1 Tax=Pseudomonas syringae TaxID=317 RepID=UPI001F460936|nr:TrfA [Pseudomonas syringae]MCF5371358.1 TrfA [Pseudomonas syringae]MCF5382484.1 TrfA [Pseudomonas syringae]MCF5419371.1 TrfA [Pseudomonas syringae]MCF5455522.1 TrfA [Pseudomonas syringae]